MNKRMYRECAEFSTLRRLRDKKDITRLLRHKRRLKVGCLWL